MGKTVNELIKEIGGKEGIKTHQEITKIIDNCNNKINNLTSKDYFYGFGAIITFILLLKTIKKLNETIITPFYYYFLLDDLLDIKTFDNENFTPKFYKTKVLGFEKIKGGLKQIESCYVATNKPIDKYSIKNNINGYNTYNGKKFIIIDEDEDYIYIAFPEESKKTFLM